MRGTSNGVGASDKAEPGATPALQLLPPPAGLEISSSRLLARLANMLRPDCRFFKRPPFGALLQLLLVIDVAAAAASAHELLVESSPSSATLSTEPRPCAQDADRDSCIATVEPRACAHNMDWDSWGASEPRACASGDGGGESCTVAEQCACARCEACAAVLVGAGVLPPCTHEKQRLS
jgi:hypothetical protein